jgi:hypothetical protein
MKKRKDIYERLIRAARKLPENEQAPYAFEKRIMAQLRDIKPVDNVAMWALGLWKAAVPCVAVMLLITTWATLSSSVDASASSSDSLASELQLTMTQPLQALEESW